MRYFRVASETGYVLIACMNHIAHYLEIGLFQLQTVEHDGSMEIAFLEPSVANLFMALLALTKVDHTVSNSATMRLTDNIPHS